MRLIVFPQVEHGGTETEPNLLAYALRTAPLDAVVLGAILRLPSSTESSEDLAAMIGTAARDNTVWAAPARWQARPPRALGQTTTYTDSVGIDAETMRRCRKHPWAAVSNGRFVTRMNFRLLADMVADGALDVIAVTVSPELAAYRERVRLTQQGRLVGYRRLYGDSVEPAPVPITWPHHVFIRRGAADAIMGAGLPPEFPVLVERCQACGLDVKSVTVAGSVVDLSSQEGLVSLCRELVGGTRTDPGRLVTRERDAPGPGGNGGISAQARFVGPVLLGNHVCVEAGAIVIGPSILCDDSTVQAGAVVDASIVGTGGTICRNQILRDSVVLAGKETANQRPQIGRACRRGDQTRLETGSVFRTWPRFSYARCVKRMTDIVAAVAVLVLFAPIIPFIALAIKASSPGPVFFKDKRQGFHGGFFQCIKFRTMRVGADKIQDKLRFVSEVDGPQFKMTDDPRITAVGRFLRETYLDEIPQFYNVLRGDMSVVGPRPSPESENTLCPWWRDARLSIRPGITGLWQICRTREPMKDFQEWIHYDTQYVRELSLRLDLWICWRTCRNMIGSFLSQF